MKKLIIVLVVVGLLSALVAPAFANKGGEPNENAAFGQMHKSLEPGTVDELIHEGQAIAESMDTNLGQLIKLVKNPSL